MSQNVIIAVLGSVIVAGGGVWYYQANVAPESANVSQERKTAAAEEEKGFFEKISGDISGSFADIIDRGDAVQCSFDGVDPETKDPIEGEIFIDGENYALRANTVIEGAEVVLNMIQKGKVMYLWTDDNEAMQALKIDVTMFGDDPEMKKESPLEMLKDPANGIDYSCKGWSPKASKFEPPKDVQFFDMFGGMMGLFGNMMKEGMMEDAEGQSGEEMEDPFAEEGGWGSENY